MAQGALPLAVDSGADIIECENRFGNVRVALGVFDIEYSHGRWQAHYITIMTSLVCCSLVFKL